MNPNDADRQALNEAMRRRAGQVPSSAGIPGGAPVANAVTPANPIAQVGETTGQNSSQPGAAGFPSGTGVKQLKQTEGGEATFIIKALADRLKTLSEVGQ